MNKRTLDLKTSGGRFGNLGRSALFCLSIFAGANVTHAEGIWEDITAWVSKGHSVISSKCNRVVDEGKDLTKGALKQGLNYQYKIAQRIQGQEFDSNTASGTPRRVVVLVRGYGGANAKYWETMAELLRKDNYDVWDATSSLDGSLSVSANALLLETFISIRASLIQQQSEVPQRLSIIAHSMGGQITRAYLGLDKPLIPVDCVIMLSPTLCGSWVGEWTYAKKMDTSFGSYKWDSTHDVSVKGALFFNAAHRYLPGKSSGTKFYALAGTDVSGILSSFSITIESSIDSVLCDEGGGTPTEKINDCMVTYKSSWGDVDRAEAKYGRAIGIAQDASVIGFDGKFYVNNNHLNIITDRNVYFNFIKPLLGGSTQQSTHSVKRLHSTMALNSESTLSSTPYSMIAIRCGTIPSEGSVSIAMPIDSTPEAQFALSTSTNVVSLTLQSPDGVTITPSSTNNNPSIKYEQLDGSQFYSVSNPVTGQWAMTVACGAAGTNLIGYTTFTSARSPLTFAVACSPAFVRTNEQVTIIGKLLNAGAGVAGAVIAGQVYAPDGSTNAVTLSDDGLHGDSEAGDGVYGVQFSATQQVGIYGINVMASGTETTGEAFEREGLGQVTFTAFSPIAELMDVYADYGIDLAPTNGLIDDFIIEVGVRVKEAGTFTVSGVLTGTNGVGITSATAEVTATEAGTQTVLLRFDAPTIYDSGALGGFDLKDLVLFGTGNNCALLDARTNAYATAGYDYFQFERADKDGDGLSDLLEEKLGTDPELVDSDFDKMPDKWENDNRLGPLVDDTALDADQDGMTNYEEYLAGTDPQDNASNLSIIDMTGRIESEDDGHLSIAFRSVPQRKYAVLRAESLSGPWVQVGEPFVALSAESRVSFQKVPTQRCAFYRIALADEF